MTITPLPFRIVVEDTHLHTKSYAQVLWDWLLPTSYAHASIFTNRNEANATALVLGRRLGAKVITDLGISVPGTAPLADIPLSVYITQERVKGLDASEMKLSLDEKGVLPIELMYANHDHCEWALSPNLAWQVDQEKARFDQSNDF